MNSHTWPRPTSRSVPVCLDRYSGTGKLTIAGELVRQPEASGRMARLLDNHAARAGVRGPPDPAK